MNKSFLTPNEKKLMPVFPRIGAVLRKKKVLKKKIERVVIERHATEYETPR